MIGVLRAAAALYRGHLLALLRSRTAAYFTLLLPLLFLFIFGFVFGRIAPGNFDRLMPSLFTITIVSGSLFSVSIRMVTERETGVLRRYRLAPVSALSIVLAHGMMAFTTMAASVLVQAVVARLVFGFGIHGSALALAEVVALGGFSLVPFGLVVGSVASDTKVAPMMTNMLMFPLMFLSGSAIPFALLPEWMQRLARLVPTTYMVESLQAVIVRGLGPLEVGEPVLLLLVTGFIGVAMNAMVFRWEGTERVRWRNVLLATMVLALIYVVAFYTEPGLHIGQGFD